MAKPKKEVKPEVEVNEDNTTENQEVVESKTTETADESKEEITEIQPDNQGETETNEESVINPETTESTEESEGSTEEETEPTEEPEREITEYDMLVMEDTGTGLAKTTLKVKVNRTSPFLREKIVIDDTEKDSVMGWGEDYILLSQNNPYPRKGLKRGQIITCI